MPAEELPSDELPDAVWSVPAAAVPVVPEVPSAVVPAVVPEVFPVAAAFSTESPEIVNESTEVFIPASAYSSVAEPTPLSNSVVLSVKYLFTTYL